ncbi:hypothetical protein ACNKHQ_08785 [Shigella flexneri]
MSDNALAEQITIAGLEVDAVEAVAGSFNNVVVGEVVECAQHPDADKLRVTKVNVGEAELLDIVCGAPNCRRACVCRRRVGATLRVISQESQAAPASRPTAVSAPRRAGHHLTIRGVIELADAPIGTNIREYLTLDASASM